MIPRYVPKSFLLVGGLLWAGGCVGPGQGWAEPAVGGGPRIGVVNLDKVLKEYKRTQTQEAALEKFSKEKQAEREKKVSEIRTLRDEIALLNEENRTRQRQVMEDQLRALAEFDQELRATLQSRRAEALHDLYQEIEGVVNAVAQQQGVELVLSDRAVLYVAESLDLTGEVVKRLNAEYDKKGAARDEKKG